MPFDRAIRWHRWNGRALLVVIAAHGARMVKQQGVGAALLGDCSPNEVGYGPCFGTAALVLLLVLTLFAVEVVRTHYFEVFKAAHMILFPARSAWIPARKLVHLCSAATRGAAPGADSPRLVGRQMGTVMAFLHVPSLMLRCVAPALILWAFDRVVRKYRAVRNVYPVLRFEALSGAEAATYGFVFLESFSLYHVVASQTLAFANRVQGMQRAW